MFYPSSTWHADGLRWIAGLLTDLASFMDRMDSSPSGRAAIGPDEACDEARARFQS
ncbi:MAG TPA: hypothetical protein VM051_10725 [Usitatibacter sp.]|nr:hypothetical protein [Usitatibacter sp.]